MNKIKNLREKLNLIQNYIDQEKQHNLNVLHIYNILRNCHCPKELAKKICICYEKIYKKLKLLY